MKKPTVNQFRLDKLKLEKGGSGVEIRFTLENVIGAEHFFDKQTVISHKIPHPDLMTRLSALKPMLLSTSGRKPSMDTMNLYTVTGVSISGDESKGVIITGTYECLNKTRIAVVTPRIKLDEEIFECEEELNDVIKVIETEAFKYIFEDKQAQLAIEFGNEENEQEAGKDK